MVSKQEKTRKAKVWRELSVIVPLEGTTATFEDRILTIKGEKGENKKEFKFPQVYLELKGDEIIIGTKKFTQRQKKMIFTFKAHIKNMIKGVKEGFEYKLVVVYAKFPMTVALKGDTFLVKNLLGEKVPRTFKVSSEAKVVIKGKDITVTGINKEIVGQTAANIEQLCRITNLDRRVVQDGIFITKKPHMEYV